MARNEPLPRRTFLKQAAGAIGAATQVGGWPALGEAIEHESPAGPAAAAKDAAFPRVFTGRKLKMIAFPLGGVAAGSVALGGRGQLRDWEIFNRPNKGYSTRVCIPVHLGAGRRWKARRPRAGGAHPSAVRRAGWAGLEQRAGPEPAGCGHLHRRVSAGAHRL